MARKRKKKKKITIHSTETKIIIGVLTLIGGISVAIAPFTQGEIFTSITEIVGGAAIFWGALVIAAALRILFDHPYINSSRPLIGLTILALVFGTGQTFFIPAHQLANLQTLSEAGGSVGVSIHENINGYVGDFIEFLILIFAAIIAFSLLSGITLEQMRDFIGNILSGVTERMEEARARRQEAKLNKQEVDIVNGTEPTNLTAGEAKEYIGEQGTIPAPPPPKKEITEEIPETDTPTIQTDPVVDTGKKFIGEDAPPTQAKKTDDDVDPFGEPQYSNWQFPPNSIFQDPVINPIDNKVHKRNAVVIEKTLRSFGLETRINKITVGPTVVQYALSITVGTKVSKIRNLSTDIALALATPESQVRIEAPIAGTSLIGIEIPNPTPNFVFIRDMIEELQKPVNREKFTLPIIMGKNVAGQPIIRELTTLPHLLVAGATGTGKSVGINAVITGLLMTNSPDELKLILVDPKMVEMAPYNGIPYLLTPVITDMELVVNALQWTVEEMLRRYRMLKQTGVRNIKEYNKKLGYTGMPYIVVIIDEMADLMLSTGVDVETKIVRLAQMARAVGIHLILATQRPSVDVITGLIKANVPGRMAFAVSTSVDSRVIVDQPGAEALIGKGDMMFRSPESGRPTRIQGAFTTITDTENLVSFIKTQVDENQIDYKNEITESHEEKKGDSEGGGSGSEWSDDEMFVDAVRLVCNTQKASASMLQRKLRIGYNRAARLIDEMHEAGVIGPAQGSSPRRVMISDPDAFFNAGEQQEEDDHDQEEF